MAAAGLLLVELAPVWWNIPVKVLLCCDMAEVGLDMVGAVGEQGEWRFLLCRSDEHEVGAC